MSATVDGIGLPAVLAGVVVLALNAYVLTGGADFGGGVWDLLATRPRKQRQRDLVARAIGPIWEANHVWLIVAIVVLFTAFPGAFAAITVVLHIPLTIMLIGIVLRGAAFVFRNYGSRETASQRRWERVFAVTSTIAPVFLGVNVGAIASGAVGARIGPDGVPVSSGSFVAGYVWPWLAPFPIAVGALSLALFAMLAAVYLTIEADEQALRDDFRRRALGAAGAVMVVALGGLAVARSEAPRMHLGLTGTAWALPLQLLVGLSACTTLFALLGRRWGLARVAAAAQASLMLWGWALAQYPYLVPSAIGIRQAAAPAVTLRLLALALLGGGVVLVPSLLYLFRTFAAAKR
jgi:cytochrome bd ubiquinol oxidase subunit II